MPKLLRIFLPTAPAYSTWTRVHDWGTPTGSGGFEDHLRLETTAATPLLAACDGVLSIFANALPLVGAPFVQPWLLPVVLPPTVSLFLNLRPRALRRTNLAGFLYRNIETSSLAPTLGAVLDSVVIGTTPTTRDQVVQFLVRGMAHVPVTAGQPIGLPAPLGSSSTRQFGLAAIKSLGIGTIDPLGTFDDLRDEVEDGQPQVDLLLQAFPRPTDLFDPALSEAAAIARTATRLYPWSTLQRLATRYGLGPASSQWRTIGNNQKALYLERLRVRVGHGGTSAAPPFEFNDADLHNVFQLEAIVEFYANFHDPWKPGATPISSSTPPLVGAAARSVGNWVSLDGGPNLASLVPNHDKIYLPASSHPSATYRIIEVDVAGSRVRTEGRPALPAAPAASPWRIAPYQAVNLLDTGGIAAAEVPSAPGVLQLDLDADLTRVWPNESPVNVDEPRDTIYLEQDQGRPSKLYKIIGVDHQQKRVTVDAPPALNNSGRWRITHRPYLVIVDPFGARLQGEGATTQPAAPDRILLPGANLARVNAHFDTIYLASDTARPSRTYSILEANDAADWVRIAHDAANPVPSIGSGSRWYLQAGVGGVPAQVNYNLTSGRGFDHYDGMMFLLHGGAIVNVAAWTSYTTEAPSRNVGTSAPTAGL